MLFNAAICSLMKIIPQTIADLSAFWENFIVNHLLLPPAIFEN